MSPIVDLQRGIAEAGRIRIGHQVPTSGGRTRPEKLSTFRLTSADRRRIEEAAGLFGGTVAEWQAPAGKQWEVVTEATEIEVIVPPAAMAFSQHLELWSAGGCQRRCDGVTEALTEQPCICGPDPEKRECDIHTRLSVMIRDLPGLALWRLDTQGWYAARELAGAVEILTLAAGRGLLLPARLLLEQRSVKRPGKDGKPQTLRFAVPRLDPGITPGELLLSGQTGGLSLPALIEGDAGEVRRMTPVPQIEGPRPTIAEQSAPPPARPARRNAAPAIPASGRRRATPGKSPGDDGYWQSRTFAEGAERGMNADGIRAIAAESRGVPIETFSMSSLDEEGWQHVHALVVGFPPADGDAEPAAAGMAAAVSMEVPAEVAEGTTEEPNWFAEDQAPGSATAAPGPDDLAERIRLKASGGRMKGTVTDAQKERLRAIFTPLGRPVTTAGLMAIWPGLDINELTAAQANAVVMAADSDADFEAHWRSLVAAPATA